MLHPTWFVFVIQANCIKRRCREPVACAYMNRFLKHWRLTGCGATFRAHVVAYAGTCTKITNDSG